MKVRGLVGVVIILTASVFAGFSFFTPDTLAQHTEHDLIIIEGDEDFIGQAANESWSGDGSEVNPFIIANYEFNLINISFNDRDHGIIIKNTTLYFEIRDCIVERGYNSHFGIFIENVENGVIRNCTLRDDKHGIYINNSKNIEVDGNMLINNRDNGITIEHSLQNKIRNNIISDNTDHGIFLENSFHNNISNNEVSSKDHKIYLKNSNDNLVDNNRIQGWNMDYGIYLESSTGNNVFQNSINATYVGIYIRYSNGTTVYSNSLTNNSRGISVSYSVNIDIQFNTMVRNGITFMGNEIEHWNTHEIGTSNTVNGKPIQYWKDQTSGTIPEGAGQVILANCQNVTVSDQAFSNVTTAIELGFSKNCNITGNGISPYIFGGIYLAYSINNSISLNKFEYSRYGINIKESDGNRVTLNEFSGVSEAVYVSMSKDTEIRGNNISNSRYGIFMEYQSQNCNITENIFINSSIVIWDMDSRYVTTYFIDTSNTVNGKPVYFWKNRNGGTVPTDAGEVILVNCTDVTIEDQAISDTPIGIQVICSQNVTLINNSLTDNHYSAFHIWNSSQMKIENNSLHSNNIGVYLYESWENIIISNNLTYNDVGVMLLFSGENQITMNNYLENDRGISLQSSNNNSIIQNTVQRNIITGIALHSSSTLNIISDNQVMNNYGSGIGIYSNSNNLVTNNNISSNGENGIFVSNANWNNIQNNIISLNKENGIEISRSNNVMISDNTIYDNEKGILLTGSEWASIHNNTMSRNGLMIIMGGSYYWDTHEIDESNTVNGKPLYYRKGQIGGTIPSGGGQVILAGCTDVTVEDQVIEDTTVAISIGYSTNCSASNNSLGNNHYGIYHVDSQDTNITQNSVSNNYYGIYLDRGNHRRNPTNISGNSVLKNTYGFYLYRSNYNNIIANNITDNEIGIFMEQSYQNILHHNNYIDNAVQLNITQGSNTWDDQGGEEGNYWSDYQGSDVDGDGVGDTQIPHLEVDEFPLMEPADITREYEVQVTFEDPVFDNGEPYRPSPLALALIMIVLVVIIILLTKPARKKKPDESPPLGWDMHGLGFGTTPVTEGSDQESDLDPKEEMENKEIEGPDKPDDPPKSEKDR